MEPPCLVTGAGRGCNSGDSKSHQLKSAEAELLDGSKNPATFLQLV